MAADEQCSAVENLFDGAACLLQPLVHPPAVRHTNDYGTLVSIICHYTISSSRPTCRHSIVCQSVDLVLQIVDLKEKQEHA